MKFYLKLQKAIPPIQVLSPPFQINSIMKKTIHLARFCGSKHFLTNALFLSGSNIREVSMGDRLILILLCVNILFLLGACAAAAYLGK